MAHDGRQFERAQRLCAMFAANAQDDSEGYEALAADQLRSLGNELQLFDAFGQLHYTAFEEIGLALDIAPDRVGIKVAVDLEETKQASEAVDVAIFHNAERAAVFLAADFAMDRERYLVQEFGDADAALDAHMLLAHMCIEELAAAWHTTFTGAAQRLALRLAELSG